MAKRLKLIIPAFIFCTGVVLGGCSLVAQPADVTTETPTKVLSGEITGSKGAYYLRENGGVSTAIESRKIDFANYLGQKVSVTGEFSGTTLFVDKVD